MMTKTIAKSITKNLDVNQTPQAVFEFLADPMNWPQFAVINLKSVKPSKGTTFQIVSKNGPGELRMLLDKSHGILDHVWTDAQASWNVYMRVIPNRDGSTLITTFFQPAQIDAKTFARSMEEMDTEFSKLKSILET